MQRLQYLHLNQNNYVSLRYMQVTDGEYDRFCYLRDSGYEITTEHDGYDRLLLTIQSNRGYLPKIEKFCSYSDIESRVIKSIDRLAYQLVEQEVLI
jgi:hypothetical protein